ncbi:hypothetical protein K491DRAFT_124944 [Lophiostoma macrostomum CBS 122681]|uniref:Uncharacterized protein n=1 Tax=Lophiostoma macrostomum CBS 122681 TaxID=1314788 RepID=A0A6A6SW63_9PLEO|nr:hypothetical protein K491DRAFT_124944 [Lophiostoma macrostomum CBS 122681]
MPDETIEGGYPYVDYQNYAGVGYERLLSWKAGHGRISMGQGDVEPQRSDLDTKGVLLPPWHSVVVSKMYFKIVPKASHSAG